LARLVKDKDEKKRGFMSLVYGLIADIGGTNARFAIVTDQGVDQIQVLSCAEFPSLTDAAQAYLAKACGKDRPQRAAFAIAGPVAGDAFSMANHHWKFSIRQTGQDLGMSQGFFVINDFEAVARGISNLTKADYSQIGGQQTPKQHGTIAIIGPGTGLGVASLFWDGQEYRPNAGEGGHVTMPAKTQREFDIFRTLYYKYHHISAERVCSGKGLINIYNAIRILDGRNEDLPERTAEQISEAAMNGTCNVSKETLDLMLTFLGRIAGNLALTLGASGGVYIAGGIPTKLGDYFSNSKFREEFEAKGRFKDYLAPIPTYLITHPNIAFLGLQKIVSNKH
jgi:glucokinase